VLGCIAELAGLLAHYPPGALWMAAALAAYAALWWVKPAFWLFVVPALLHDEPLWRGQRGLRHAYFALA
jgi:hypothetical protein